MLAVILAGAASLHAPAHAQAGEPVAQGKVPRWSDARGTGQNMEIQFYQGFARCVGTYGRQYGEVLLSTTPNSSLAIAAGKQIGQRAGGCLSHGSARLIADRARGAIAEFLVETADKTPLIGISPFAVGETFQSFVSKIMPGRADASGVPAPVVARWAAFCAARENRAGILEVLATPPGSRRELESLDRLNPTLSNCIAGDQVLNTNVRSFRAYLAESLYWHSLPKVPPNA